MKFFIATALTASLLFSQTACKSLKNEGKDEVFLVFKRTPCFGKCPVFDFTFYRSGRLVLNAREFVMEKGRYETQLKHRFVKRLETRLINMDFCSFDNKYGEGIADLPSAIFIYKCNGLEKTVDAVMNFPGQLEELNTEFMDLLEQCDWKPIEEKATSN
ncbi:hypothetical protein GC194_01090 [bacterium]|nr:hypothetical protein [bacterium]